MRYLNAPSSAIRTLPLRPRVDDGHLIGHAVGREQPASVRAQRSPPPPPHGDATHGPQRPRVQHTKPGVGLLLAAGARLSARRGAPAGRLLRGGDGRRCSWPWPRPCTPEEARAYAPGVAGADSRVGPPLDEAASRMYIAGRLTNTPQHMIRWILDPRAVDSATAVPTLGISERDARDIAAYLYAIGGDRDP